MNRKALVVIDIQNDITKHYRDIIDRLNATIEWAAESGMDIREFYITGADATACVKSTCFNMTKAGYTVHVISDCVTSYDLKKMPEMLAYYTDKGCEVKNLAIYMGMNYQYKRLDNNNFTGYSLDDFVRHQTVTECWRKTDNDWKLVPNAYEENWSQVQCRALGCTPAEEVNDGLAAAEPFDVQMEYRL